MLHVLLIKHASACAGNVGWGISWYINGLLIPEVTVVRGQTYTFVVEGGHDSDRPSRHHPFYITDDPEGGYEFKTPAERAVLYYHLFLFHYLIALLIYLHFTVYMYKYG